MVLGTEARTLATAPATEPRQFEIRFQGSRADVNDFLNGGRIGGLLEFQNKVLDPAPVSYTHLDVYKRQVMPLIPTTPRKSSA